MNDEPMDGSKASNESKFRNLSDLRGGATRAKQANAEAANTRDFLFIETRQFFTSSEHTEKTRQVEVESKRSSRTQVHLMAVFVLGISLMVWDRLDAGFEAPLILGVGIHVLMILLPIAGFIGKEVIAAIMDGIVKLNAK